MEIKGKERRKEKNRPNMMEYVVPFRKLNIFSMTHKKRSTMRNVIMKLLTEKETILKVVIENQHLICKEP